jgi:opacity protein-like surface antigen
MTRTTRLALFLTIVACIAPPTAAHAQGFVTPFVGTTFNSPDVGSAKNGSKAGFGVDLGTFGTVLGFEADFAYYPEVLDNDIAGLEKNHVVTVTGNALVSVPIPRVRPYATVGVGFLKLDATNLPSSILPSTDTSQTKFAWSIGGGVMGFFTDHLGVRGDVRYFRAGNFDTDAFRNDTGLLLDQFDFWRAAIGLAAKF